MRISENEILNLTNVIETVASDYYPIEHLVGFSVNVSYKPLIDNFTGTIIIQASNDLSVWCDVIATTINHTETDYIYNIRDVFYKYVRVKFVVEVGGAETVKAIVYAKGF